MKYFLLAVAVIIGSSLLLGNFASDFVDESRKTNLEKYCEQLKTWHPDCKIE
jgi:hypothetical protein